MSGGQDDMIKSLPSIYSAMSARYLNTKSTPPCFPSPAPTLSRLSWKAMHLGTRRKALHRVSPGQRSILNILAGPLPSSSSWQGLAALHSSEHALEEGREGAASTTPKKDDKKPKKKCVKTCWCFIVWTKDATSLKFHTWFLSLWRYQR